jgi:hypothetical protein
MSLIMMLLLSIGGPSKVESLLQAVVVEVNLI